MGKKIKYQFKEKIEVYHEIQKEELDGWKFKKKSRIRIDHKNQICTITIYYTKIKL